MSDLISIGRFAQLTRLTIKALHLYDALGLLRPAIVDAESGYRYYRITQVPLAHRIRLLRSLDMPLEAIEAVVHAPTPMAIEALLRDQRRRIADRIARDQHALRLVQQLIDHHDDDLAFTVQTKELPPQLVASIRIRTSPDEETRIIPVLIDELVTITTRLGIRCHAQPPVRISHEYSEDRVDSEIAVPITAPMPDTERVTCQQLAAGTVAWVMHIGPHAELWAVYWAILVWIQEHEYDQHGPPREVYRTHPAASQAMSYRTEVQWPIRPRDWHSPQHQGPPYARA